MSDLGFAFFETAIGRCGVVWSARGITGVQLPEKSEDVTRSRLLRRYPTACEDKAPAEVQRAMERIVALLCGEPDDLADVEVDPQGVSDFNRRVYEITRAIRPGATLSYGEIAAQLGDRMLARDVAQALSENRVPIIVPCHRVLAAGGKMGGYSGPGGVRTKLRLLSIEGAQPEADPMLFDRLPLAPASPHRA